MMSLAAPQNPPLNLLLAICLLLLGSCAGTPPDKEDDSRSSVESEPVEWLELGVTTKDDVLLHLREIAETNPDNEGLIALAHNTYDDGRVWLFIFPESTSIAYKSAQHFLGATETLLWVISGFRFDHSGGGRRWWSGEDLPDFYRALTIEFDEEDIVRKYELELAEVRLFRSYQRCTNSGVCDRFIRVGGVEEEAAKSGVVPPDLCAVYVYGASGGGGFGDSYEVGLTLDGDYKGGYAPYTFVRWLVVPGQHRLRADILHYKDFKQTRHTQDFDCPAGGALFFEAGQTGGFIWHVGLENIKAQKGKRAIERRIMFDAWVDGYKPLYEREELPPFLEAWCSSSSKIRERRCSFGTREHSVWPPPFTD